MATSSTTLATHAVVQDPTSRRFVLITKEGRVEEHAPLSLTVRFLQSYLIWTVSLKKRIARNKKISTHSKLCDGLTPSIRIVREGAARWPALDAIYNWQPTIKGWRGNLEKQWFMMKNCQALRNRYAITVELLRQEMEITISRKGSVKIVSLASGTCQTVFDAALSFPADKVEILCLDSDETALDSSRELRASMGLSCKVHHVKDDVVRLDKVETLKTFQPDIIEVVGIIDYLKDRTLVRLLSQCHNLLAEGGTLITAHIHDNPERKFLDVVLDWDPKMLYRTKAEFQTLIENSSFKKEYGLETEAWGIHTVARCVRH